jgi:bacterial leucyl aminopeptidase
MRTSRSTTTAPMPTMFALLAFVGGSAFTQTSLAQTSATQPRSAAHAHARDHARAELAALHLTRDSQTPIYIVTSRASHTGLTNIATKATSHRDSIGTELVVSEVQAKQLSLVSEFMHTRELRCGGFFAFATRAEAEAFIRNDRSQVAMRKALLASYTIDNAASVNPWLSQVQATNIASTITTLSNYQNRYYTSSDGRASAEWIRNTWQGLAGTRTDVTSELFSCATCSTQPSVILTIQGTDLPSEVVVLGAHLDSINGSAGGSTTQRAPGADDDASGIATLTEVLRIAMTSG